MSEEKKQCWVITAYDCWEYAGVCAVCLSEERAKEMVASFGFHPRANCRCGKRAGTPGHKDCSLSSGYEIEVADLEEE